MRTMRQPDITQLGYWGDAHILSVQGSGHPPPEVTMGSLCVQTYNKVMQDQLRCDDIDLFHG
jgi:hypothetical protein